jgi:LacI family transcriptional regulator
MAKSTTITEVAKLAGVSVITASRAIRGVGPVADATREKVLKAAEQINYTPDLLAQRMRGGSSKLIGVFIRGFGSAVLHDLITSINEEARGLGYDLLIFNAENFDVPGRAPTSEMMRKLCDGLLLILPDTNDSILGKLERAKSPCVLINFAGRDIDIPVVVGANRAGARQAVEHLIELGHERIAFIAGTAHTGQSAERQRGYEEALAAAGLALRPEYIGQGEFTYPTGHRAARKLFALEEPPTAVFAANDAMAFGVIDAAVEHGLSVPADLSVVGYDDIMEASYLSPKLTTLRQPLAEIGARAVRELANAIKGKGSAAARVELPSKFIIRGSTGPAPQR